MNRQILAIVLIMITGAAFLSGCVEGDVKGERAQMLDTQKTETLKYSNERKIFQGYLDQVNNPNNIQFIYLMSLDGHVIYRSTAMGKTISESYKKDHRNPQFWTMTENENYENLRFATNGYIQQCNRFVTDYNNRMRDITTNQKWMKPENFPDYLELYVEGKSIVTEENNQTLVQPNEIPQAPPDCVPPRT